MAQMMIPLALCCSVVCSSSFAMQFMGGGLGGLFDTSKITGTMKQAPAGALCKGFCGDCSQAKYDKMHAGFPEEPASNFKAVCENNRSAYSGTQAHWDTQIRKAGTNCC